MTASPRLSPALRAALACAALAAGFAASGCTETSPTSLASLSNEPPPPPPPTNQPALHAYADTLAPRYAAHPEDKVVAIRYARALRGLTQYAQAVAVLQRLAVKYPNDMIVLGAYGKALADAGRLQEAAEVLEHSHTPDRPNWTILSAQGTVADQMGDHAHAQAYYDAALKLVPNEPEVMSNLGLSYALQHQLPLAESTLRQAAAQPSADARVRENLALVLTIEGKDAAAQQILQSDQSPVDAAETLQSLRQMVAQSDQWRALAGSHHRLAAAPRPSHDASHVAARDTTRTASADDVQ